jgi:hypothetical protein
VAGDRELEMGVGRAPSGHTEAMLWTLFIILGIIAFVLIIVGRRRV